MSQYSPNKCGRRRGRFDGACKRNSLAGDIGCFWHIGLPKYNESRDRSTTEDVQDNNEGGAQMSKWCYVWRPVHPTYEKEKRNKWQKD